MYKNEVIDALQKLSDKALWTLNDLQTPMRTQTNEDRNELCDLCMKVFGVFKRI